MNSKNLLICSCNSCNKGFCYAKTACYMEINEKNCKKEACLGCFDEFQEFQVKIGCFNKSYKIIL